MYWDASFYRSHPTEWTNYVRTGAQSVPLMEIEEACAHLRVDPETDDDYIESLIEVATTFIEGPSGIGIALRTQTWQLRLDHLPQTFCIALGPVQSITSITVDGVAIDPTQYHLVGDQVRGSNAGRSSGAVVVTFVAGYGANVPVDIVHAAKLLVGHWYAFREAALPGGPAASPMPIPYGVEAILSRYRRY